MGSSPGRRFEDDAVLSDAHNPEEAAFRDTIRAFLKEKVDLSLEELAARQAGLFAEGELAKRCHAALFEQGWVAPAWPKEYGGPGWSWRQRQIFFAEISKAGMPPVAPFGVNLCGPVIMKFGTAEQKAFFLPRILSNEHYWCQGFSEPQSGSDLASLQTRAVSDGDAYVINGTKIWTTHAHHANWIFMLVRTSIEGAPQRGISFVVTPLNAPGISIRPIYSISGEHELNQVFFDNVRVPKTNRFGEENEGWGVAKYLFEFERAGSSLGVTLRLAIERTVQIARQTPGDDGQRHLIDDPVFRHKLAALEIQVMAAEALDQLLSARLQAGDSIGTSAASMKKLVGSQLGQAISELSMEALGPYAVADQREALSNGAAFCIGPEYALTPTVRYLNGRATTIFGGSSEIQRNILAKTALGL
jgi:alkylation response protein AidB-like acyl-CoA dehydrogenase